MPKNVEDLDKLIVAKDFKKLPKVQQIAQSGHTGPKHAVYAFIIYNQIFTIFVMWKEQK